ncbi:hypothetical protein quinque_000244, partial [Culex quinquefasciatus]
MIAFRSIRPALKFVGVHYLGLRCAGLINYELYKREVREETTRR